MPWRPLANAPAAERSLSVLERTPLMLYGRALTSQVFTFTAVWYSALRAQPVCIVVVRDPSRRRHDGAFFCTERDRDAAFILATYSRRWTLEVTFYDAKQHLGFG